MCLKIDKIADGLYQLNESADQAGTGKPQPYVDAYLLVGSDRAALIDSLQNTAGLYEEVRKLTDLPVDVLITHGHGDHVGISVPEFVEAGCKIYMSLKDYEGLLQMSDFVKKEWFTDLQDGDRFDLGGFVLETIACGGHTPGSVAYLEREKQWLFSGDTIGSGNFWMQLPGSLPMNVFQTNVKRLYETVREMKELLVYPGHRNQSPVQLNLQYVKDTCTIADRLLDGTLDGEERVLDFAGMHMKYKCVGHGMMREFCYDPAKLR